MLWTSGCAHCADRPQAFQRADSHNVTGAQPVLGVLSLKVIPLPSLPHSTPFIRITISNSSGFLITPNSQVQLPQVAMQFDLTRCIQLHYSL
jgi:hypothetical protein